MIGLPEPQLGPSLIRDMQGCVVGRCDSSRDAVVRLLVSRCSCRKIFLLMLVAVLAGAIAPVCAMLV